MGRQTYDKLVRDRIPDIIVASGRACAVEEMDHETYVQYLHKKVLEEAAELAEAPEDERGTELADLYQVIGALVEAYGLSLTEVEAIRKAKLAARGGFERRLRLLWAE